MKLHSIAREFAIFSAAIRLEATSNFAIGKVCPSCPTHLIVAVFSSRQLSFRAQHLSLRYSSHHPALADRQSSAVGPRSAKLGTPFAKLSPWMEGIAVSAELRHRSPAFWRD
jgi:hypothetical protein